ncbi:MAG: DUF11 domain-containing protein, partial [Candidatus Nanopelagicales bacterium]|nr:DUF11 domain-containing protein [Candidatus Nanopelagicales bacterium]
MRGPGRAGTYDYTVPLGTSVSVRLTDDAGVRSYQAFTNLPGQAATYFPQNNIDPSVPVADRDAPRADDPSNVVLPNATVTKTSVTSVTATNNNVGTQATIGETVTYTYGVTIPARTTVYAGALTDVLPTGFLISGPATGEFCPVLPPSGQPCAAPTPITTAPGTTLPGGTVTLDSAVGALAFGPRYDNTTTTAQRFSVTIPVQVTQAALAESANAEDRSNRAEFRSTLTAGGSAIPTRTATRTINVRQPAPVVTKANSTTGPVAGGVPVTFTVTARNQDPDGTTTNRPPLYDAVLVDCVPAQLQVVAGSVSDGGTIEPGTGTNGCAATATRISWPVGTVEPGAAIPRTYQALVTPAAVGGDIYTNTVGLTGTSMPGPVAGERTYTANAISEVEILGAGLSKSVDKDELTIGETATWTIRATVPADVTFFGAALLDTVPAGVTDVALLDVTCRALGVDCAPQFPALGTPLRPSPTTVDGSVPVTYGWLVGDGLAAPAPRVITLRYTGRVADLPLNVAGRDLVNSARAGWFERPVDPPTDAGQAFPRTSQPVTATSNVVEPRVTVVKVVSDTSPDPGDVFEYTLRVTNGPGNDLSAASNIVIRDVVPTGVVVSPGSISDGGSIAPLPVPSTGGGTITWDATDLPGPLAPNATVELTYTARLAPSSDLTGTPPASVLRNTATVASFQSLPSGGRTYAGPSANADVTPAFPRLQAAKEATGGPIAYLGEAYTWTVSTTNTGSATAFAVDVLDLLPPNWTYLADSAQVTVAGGPATLRNPTIVSVGERQRLEWSDLGQLAPGAAAR